MNDNYTKLSESGYIIGEDLYVKDQGEISLNANEVTFSNIEFDSEFVFSWNRLICSKDETYITMGKELYGFQGLGHHGEDVSAKIEDITSFTFSGCKFSEDVSFTLNENFHLFIDYCVFEKKIRIDKNPHREHKLGEATSYLNIENTDFQDSFSISSIELNSINIKNTDFGSISEFNDVTITNQANFEEIKFKDLALFDECLFDTKVVFKYVLFENFSHFRGSTFNYGIDLEYSSSKEDMNFYDIKGLNRKESKENTSQETYRIIKHNFEKIGNRIEANKYHALELKKRRNNAPWYSLSYISLWFHWISSNHSSNWLFALFWIFMVSFITYISIDSFVWHSYNCTSNWLDYFKYMSIINLDDCIKKNPLIFLLNKISLGYLYYQFLMSVRKDTRK